MSKITFAVLCAVSLFAVGAQADQGVFTKKLNPFTDLSRVPDDAVEFAVSQVKYTQVPTTETEDFTTCSSVNNSEPGGSEFCPTVTDSGYVPAIEIDYAYSAASTADEYGNTSNNGVFTLDPTTIAMSSLNKIPTQGSLKGAAAAAVTSLNVGTASEPTTVIDEVNSHFCETVVVDGYFQHVDPSCQDQITYKTVQVPYTFATASLK